MLGLLLVLCTAMGTLLSHAERAEAYTGGLDIYVGYSGGPYYLKRHIDHERLSQMVNGPYQYVYTSGAGSGFTLKKFVGYGIPLQSLFSFAQIDPATVYRFQIGTGDNYIPDDGGAGYQDWTYNELVGSARWYFDGYADTSKFSYADGTVLDAGALNATRTQVDSILALKWGYLEYDSSTTQADLNATWNNANINKNDYRLFYGQTSMQDTTPRGSAQDVRAITIVLGGNDGSQKAEIDVKQPHDKDGNVVTDFNIGDDFAIGVDMWAHDSFVAQEALRNGDVQFYTEGDEGVVEVYFDAATGCYRVKVIGEGTVTLRYRFGNGQEGYVAEGKTSLTVTGRGSGNGSGNGKGDGADDVGGNGSLDGTGDGGSPDGSEDGNDVVLGAGTTLTPISMTPKLDMAAGLGADMVAGEEGGSAAEEVLEEEILEDDVALSSRPTYQLDMDEPEQEPLSLPDSLPPDAGWAFGGAALLGLGGVAQAVQFNRAKDPANAKRATVKDVEGGRS